MVRFEGAPKTVVTVNDTSILATTTRRSICCVQGITQLGVPGVPVKVSNWIQFRRKLGGYHSQSRFPQYCERLLASGAQLWVSPATHYSDITDGSTATGTRATGTITVASGGGAGTAVFAAKAASEGYNGVVVKTSAAKSGTSAKVDIQVSLGDTLETFLDVPEAPSTAEKTALNNRSTLVDLTTVTTRIPVGTATLAGAVQPVSSVTDNDYIGDVLGKTGWYAFNNIADARYIANIDRPIPAVDIALAAYCEGRGDLRFFVRTPIGLTAEGMVDYRMGTGLYSHTPINSWLGTMIGGAITVLNPQDTTQQFDLSPIADAVGARCSTDFAADAGYWFSFSGSKRGVIANNDGIAYNLGSPALQDEANDVANAGIIYAIEHPSFGPVFWGNATLYRDTTKLLSNENIANLAMYVKRALPAFADGEMFQPNEPATWATIYRNALGFIGELENGRAIRPGEGQNWFWYGDQHVTDVAQLVYNTVEDIDAGIYRIKFLFIPINATKFIAIEATLTDSKTISSQVIQP